MRRARSSALIARVTALVLTVGAALALGAGWHFFEWDMALSTYGVAAVIAVYGMVFRFMLWAQRPPTKRMYLRALHEMKSPVTALRSVCASGARIHGYFALNTFVWKRGAHRWLAHWPIMLGCVMAAQIAFPLVFGWVWFRTPAHDMSIYECMAFGIPLFQFPIDSWFAFFIFHGLVWASFPVIFGVTCAFIRRLQNRGDQAVQNFMYDFLPLVVLLTVAVSGLLLSVSYTWFAGYAHEGIAIFHAIVVIMCMLCLPYTKFSHIPQRSLKLAHMIIEGNARARNEAPAVCSRCHQNFAAAWQIADLKSVESELGFRYELADGGHYQDVCPRCRRANLVIAQSARWQP